MEGMHDLAYFRANFDQIAERLATRGTALNLDQFRELNARPAPPSRNPNNSKRAATRKAPRSPNGSA